MDIDGLRFAIVDGELRELSLDGLELVQRIFPTVRDRHWATCTPLLLHADLRRDQSAVRHSALLAYLVDAGRVDVRIDLEIIAAGSGRCQVTYALEATADVEILFNRIGIAVLHPLSQAGAEATWGGAERVPASTGALTLPALVQPQHRSDGHEVPIAGPYRDLAITAAGTRLDWRFDGDDFEMEDQRNWSDASFKSYCTPLSFRTPHVARPGIPLRQKATLLAQVDDRPRAPVPTREQPPAADSAAVALAVWADCSSTEDLDDDSRGRALELARDLGFTDLIVYCPATATGCGDVHHRTSVTAMSLGLAVTAVRADADNLELDGPRRRTVREVATTVGPLVELQLSDLSQQHLVFLEVSPFVHASDPWSLRRNHESLPAMIATLRHRAPHAELWVGPLIFGDVAARSRFPAGAHGAEPWAASEEDVLTWVAQMISIARRTPIAGVVAARLHQVVGLASHPLLTDVLSARSAR
jgi:hypothetical protein